MGGIAKGMEGLGSMSKGLESFNKLSTTMGNVNNLVNMGHQAGNELGGILSPGGEGQPPGGQILDTHGY